ncbi:matrixin family protein [Anoxybacillus sp. B7M1]|uniref:hypothetical protein n=1 Tax=Anoxybacillaceae TaxID=3120669 RepID=UPI0005CD7CDD|nr:MULTISPECIES: hypothetical protein [Anoxybacillus]ANB57123.1 matrixin family protein [Anoxybacillus sp. B2M1]ANB65674.1 matrixin family protein [Anoxybacillus sp. B7M1]
MAKFIKKIVSVIVLFVTFSMLVPILSFAAYTNNDAFFKSGLPKYVVGDCYVFVSDSVSNYGYSTYVSNAKSGWGGISNADVDFWPAGSATDADIRVYAGNYGLDYAGLAQPYQGDSLVTDPDATTTNWSFVKIYLNDYYMDYYNYTNANRNKTTIHEFGHALGLRHQPSGTISIMVQGKLSYSGPQELDKSNIAYKY